VDLDSDGDLDVLSGSYSRNEDPMAGLFQVLWGEPDGTWRPAQALRGSDGKELELPAGDSDDVDVDRICTRPFAADLDGDGDLDLVVGTESGRPLVLRNTGTKTAPRLEPDEAAAPQWPPYAAPAFGDLDGDGDMALLLGGASGGLQYFENVPAVGGTRGAR
jgi:hypothetical protein